MDQLEADKARTWQRAAQAVIEAALPGDPNRPETWPAYAALLPHVEAALPPGSQGRAQLASFLGKTGSYAEALLLIRDIAHSGEQTLGIEHPDTLNARADLAYWTGCAGEWVAARNEFAALLPVRERALGPEHPDTLATRATLAAWTGHAGDAAARP